MAFEEGPFVQISLKSTNDLSGLTNGLPTYQYDFVKQDSGTPGNVVLCNAVTDIPIGVLQNAPKAGQTAEIVVFGITKVRAGATIAAGVLIGTTSGAQAAAYVAGTDTTKYNLGQVLLASNGSASLLTASINCMNPSRFA